MVDIYLELVRIVVPPLSSELKVSCCTLCKPGTNVISNMVYADSKFPLDTVRCITAPIWFCSVVCRPAIKIQQQRSYFSSGSLPLLGAYRGNTGLFWADCGREMSALIHLGHSLAKPSAKGGSGNAKHCCTK